MEIPCKRSVGEEKKKTHWKINFGEEAKANNQEKKSTHTHKKIQTKKQTKKTHQKKTGEIKKERKKLSPKCALWWAGG